MFTDRPVTPLRLEILLDLVRENRTRVFTKTMIESLLQPEGLPALSDQSSQARDTLGAARELELILDDTGSVRLSAGHPHQREMGPRELILAAIDSKILRDVKIEPYFALFYSFVLGLDAATNEGRTPQEWADEFNRVVKGGELGGNPLNATKYTALKRWYRYAGLGWFDPHGTFHCNPYERLARALPAIFRDDTVLEADAFMIRLGEICPELDGGKIFQEANSGYNRESRTCTLGLSQSLIELHTNDLLRLDCPVDAHGWSISAAEPPRDGRWLRSDRITHVERVS